MGYYVGDRPAQPLVVEPALAMLEGFTGATAILTSPVGDDFTLDATLDDDQIVVEWPVGDSILTAAGLYELRITLDNLDDASQRLPLVGVVVQDDTDGWHSLDTAREQWADFPENDRWLYELLEVAKSDVEAFGTSLAPEKQRAAFRRAQWMHARDIWTATEASPSGEMGEGTFAFQPHPLDWMIKQILRPKRAIGATA